MIIDKFLLSSKRKRLVTFLEDYNFQATYFILNESTKNFLLWVRIKIVLCFAQTRYMKIRQN